jgi:hypothetical protein
MVIRSREEISQLVQKQPHLHRRRGEPVVLEIAGLQSEGRRRWEFEINRFYHDCGCSAGTIGLFIAVLAFVLLDASSQVTFRSFSWRDIVAFLAACILGAAVGKAIGLWRARAKLRESVRRLILELEKNC